VSSPKKIHVFKGRRRNCDYAPGCGEHVLTVPAARTDIYVNMNLKDFTYLVRAWLKFNVAID
jgi:hypothetical protein